MHPNHFRLRVEGNEPSASGGPGGIRTPVQNPFQSTSYSLNSYLSQAVIIS